MENLSQNPDELSAKPKSDFAESAFPDSEINLERLHEELATERENRLRLAAEYENYRRRTKKEMSEAADKGKRELLERLISIADDLELALMNAGESSDAVAVGLRMIERRFHATLEANGVVGFKSKDEMFDPERHEAFDVSSTEHKSGIVCEEIRRGYLLNGKLLRPALVIVAQ